MTPPADKIAWSGTVTAVQPRVKLMRWQHDRRHGYPGYVLRIDGTVGDEQRQFLIAVGKGAHVKHSFQVGMAASGLGVAVADPIKETAELYKVSKLELELFEERTAPEPPWHGVPPTLSVYRARGHRRLAVETYAATCISCIWGCRMPVEISYDFLGGPVHEQRFEIFCYGPRSCSAYDAGASRIVPGRDGDDYEEGDEADKEAVGHRGPDD